MVTLAIPEASAVPRQVLNFLPSTRPKTSPATCARKKHPVEASLDAFLSRPPNNGHMRLCLSYLRGSVRSRMAICTAPSFGVLTSGSLKLLGLVSAPFASTTASLISISLMSTRSVHLGSPTSSMPWTPRRPPWRGGCRCWRSGGRRRSEDGSCGGEGVKRHVWPFADLQRASATTRAESSSAWWSRTSCRGRSRRSRSAPTL